MSEEPAEKPKLIIDDDWKERVQSEKEAAAKSAKSDSPTSETPATDATATDAPVETGDEAAADHEAAQAPAPDAGRATHALPPASFATLVHSLTAQALASLGQIPDGDGKVNVELGLGKHFIDTLAVLEVKTKGNLDQEEADALAKMLHELRMLFVHVQKEQKPRSATSDA